MIGAALAAILLTPVPGGMQVKIDGKAFTTYRYAGADGKAVLRPFLFPVLADDGTPLTSDQFGKGGDHPHHRSFWVAHGSVNGTDHWGTLEGPAQVPAGPPTIEGNSLTQVLDWEDNQHKGLLRETRTFRFGSLQEGIRAIDLTSTYAALAQDVVLGDTKEAGLVAIRMAASLSKNPQISAASGCKGEPECWGKAVAWCDFSANLDGKIYGIAVLDHPKNPRYPTRWHVRAYGLLAANPFGLSAFEKAPPGTGDLVLKAGIPVVFRYRVLVHLGAIPSAVFDKFASDFGLEK